jgi:predicted TPR repeat methyltransferase
MQAHTTEQAPVAADGVATTVPGMGLLQRAMAAHGRGEAADAEALYGQVLAEHGDMPDALHLLGVLNAQQGRLAQAQALIERAIAVQPAEAMFHNNLGNVCAEAGRLQEAERHYLHALELDGQRVDALNNLGVLLSHRGQADGAAQVLQRVLELAPDFRDARQNLASHHLRQGDIAKAVEQCVDGLETSPRNPVLRRLLGLAYTMLGQHAQAVQVYRHWLADEPDHAIAQHQLAAAVVQAQAAGQYSGPEVATPERAADRYVQQVFDQFARSFDERLSSLGYRAPALVGRALEGLLPTPQAHLALLDAGCGTGLCAPWLRPHARQLVGVDLSSGMLGRAQARGGYDELVCGELVAYLQSQHQRFDVIVSADTLCYFGDLTAFAQAAAQAVRPGALLVFTVESLHADLGEGQAGAVAGLGYELGGHGRYSHASAYVRQVLAAAAWVDVVLAPEVLRSEGGEPVQGWLVTARCAL